ncbi:MAG: asparagine synthase (glutamine-hydrolyzing) [Gaiellales bacterium]
MCGIAGIVNADPSRRVWPETLRGMCDAMIHRGPDDHGEYIDGHAAIGMRRLSIIDVRGGRQPITNEDGTIWVVLNGEIYNYRQLRKDLETSGHRFRTTSDTEVIVHLFEEFGEACVHRLRGMFTFGIWDARRQALMLARDRVGIKPLYYAILPEGLVFASELKAMLTHPGIPRDLDPEAVAEYFTHLCVPGELSIFKGIRKLLPAHVLTYREGRIRVSRYWQVQPDADNSRSEDKWVEQLRERLREAVELHMVADVPVGAFLSGGLDSGAMVALMARASADRIRTFTVGFTTPAGSFDERLSARAVAERHDTVHRECLLAPDVTHLLPRIVRAFDEPFADSSAIPNFLVCQETARHVKVALSGLGADELFGGYERYVALELGEAYRRIPRLARVAIAKLAGTLPDGHGTSRFSDRLKRFVATSDMSRVDRYRSFVSAFGNAQEVLHPDVHESLDRRGSQYDRVVRELTIQNSVDLGLFADLHAYLPDDLLTLTDRISMAHSLEVRVPFLDHELIEFVARMPARFKIHGFRKKVLFRRAIAPWLPAGHLRRPKQGFSVPLAEWLRGSLRPLLSDLVVSRDWRESPWLDPRAVRRLVDEHVSRKVSHEIRLWAIICFLEWERQYVRTPVAATASSLV